MKIYSIIETILQKKIGPNPKSSLPIQFLQFLKPIMEPNIQHHTSSNIQHHTSSDKEFVKTFAEETSRNIGMYHATAFIILIGHLSLSLLIYRLQSLFFVDTYKLATAPYSKLYHSIKRQRCQKERDNLGVLDPYNLYIPCTN